MSDEKETNNVLQESLQKSLKPEVVNALDAHQISQLEELLDQAKLTLKKAKRSLLQTSKKVFLGQTENQLSQKIAIHHFVNSMMLTCHSEKSEENYNKKKIVKSFEEAS